ncbi:uncharacterized protein LOC132565464 [Ylistrum balloti]|uniref:uncharacterized protein LOC132565464 n=1 Tax=Ylistrum balloti TaxID=509963 RepID=UPI002905E888|nr:uncharacterized protein LOC132565464 [Ylistrum balloti]XP_060086088.1 uncharacterized protein LOC132565464 [Ylistrum balloti]XP_060086089.1 uncharacterized protein LOC132565464 [Ylistrum balloti]XP_060086090.1 uncharacterized protein LOC132565464 [Ylistrum balloti]XP_060086091.1 uncharacterized protein LOC132565464 [Ylistrum balloti]
MAGQGSVTMTEEIHHNREGGTGHLEEEMETEVTQPSSAQVTNQNQTPSNGSNLALETDAPVSSSSSDHEIAVSGVALETKLKVYPCDASGWQFYLDYLANKLSKEISEMAAYLGVDSAKVDEIKNRCKSNRHEMCFNVLWSWYGKNPDNEKRINQINTALRESGRVDLADELMERKAPKPEDFKYKDVIKNPENRVDSNDARKVGKQLTLTFQSLARYFGLNENDIQTISLNNSDDIREQSYSAINLCIQQRKIKDRQHLCNGLVYLEKHTALDEIKKMWCP